MARTKCQDFSNRRYHSVELWVKENRTSRKYGQGSNSESSCRCSVSPRRAIVGLTKTLRPQSTDAPPRNHRNRQRGLAVQASRLTTTPACPSGQTGPSRSLLGQACSYAGEGLRLYADPGGPIQCRLTEYPCDDFSGCRVVSVAVEETLPNR